MTKCSPVDVMRSSAYQHCGIAALIMGYLHHRSYKVFLVGSIGLTLIIISTTLGHDVLGETGEVVVSILGSMIIAHGHFRNYQLSRVKHETQ